MMFAKKVQDYKERIFDVNEIKSFDDSQAKKNIFYETGQTVGAVWCLKPGQELYFHSHKRADDIWICIEGDSGTYYPECGESVEISKGMVCVARPGEKHGMKNTGSTDFVFIGIAGPVPLDLIRHELE
ncbi:cupin domain-containing protein [Listeria sp. SHR_NRA_18]|uniref:cupin domain-containing protein n=1 Tax=Listeria sp. SHR_NRA_18 TaxID=2269046 RepID=UPI000B06BF17|nr:cupin domain-containing protein [Listeria sp. SHR_NRA_18]